MKKGKKHHENTLLACHALLDELKIPNETATKYPLTLEERLKVAVGMVKVLLDVGSNVEDKL